MNEVVSIRCEGATAFIIMEEAGLCGRCRATHFFFICRDGHTLCVKCDAETHPAPASTKTNRATNGA